MRKQKNRQKESSDLENTTREEVVRDGKGKKTGTEWEMKE